MVMLGVIESAADGEPIAQAAGPLPDVVRAIMDRRIEAVDVARLMALAVDSLTRRQIELAVEQLGRPPVPWAWLALGSEARLEQGIVTDQDHAIAFDPVDAPLEEVDRYFSALAAAVTRGLETAGIPRCRADVVAVNPSLRRPIAHWVVAFEEWMKRPGPGAGRQGSILFDLRRVAGPLETERTLGVLIGSARRYPELIRWLARVGLDTAPPPTRRGSRTFDVKREGLTPLVNVARIFALESGVTSASTLERLQLANDHGRIDGKTRDALVAAFRLLWRIRMTRHAACIAQGRVPDDQIEPRTLDSGTLAGLKEAFRTIRRARLMLRRDHRLFPFLTTRGGVR
jgi:CBS domain-containing protein